MSYKQDLVGHQFWRLIVKEFVGNDEKDGNSLWRCECHCGDVNCEKEVIIKGYYLIQRKKRRCNGYLKTVGVTFNSTINNWEKSERLFCFYCNRKTPHINGKCSWH